MPNEASVTTSGSAVALERFVTAQDPVFDRVCAELRAGRKTSHWMWYVFPQLAGLGMSPMSQRYAIADLAEAKAYLAHPILSARLKHCCEILLALPQQPLVEILGAIDEMKFRSSMTLFTQVPGADPVFQAALDRFCYGEADERTLRLLQQNG